MEIRISNLSKRESSCLRLMLRGYTYQEMGEMLYINDKTVASHVQSLKHKLGIARRHEIFDYAKKKGLVVFGD